MSRSVPDTVKACFRSFLDSTERKDVAFRDESDVLVDIGCSSDEGVDFVIDLCKALNVELPEDFNPFVHITGTRGNRVSEMSTRVEQLVGSAGGR